MSSADAVRNTVREFRYAHPDGANEADSFAAWWIHRRFKVAALEAAAGAPGGNHDKGLDGFFLDESGATPTLVLIQAKYSDDLALIKKGFLGFKKLVPFLRDVIDGAPATFDPQNPVLTGLRLAVDKLRDNNPGALQRLSLRFVVVHLSEKEPESITAHCHAAIQSLADELQEHLPTLAADCEHDLPIALAKGVLLNAPAKALPVRFHGSALPSDEKVRSLAGFGYLSDLVDLYEHYREAIFSKNVRGYLPDKVAKGPARYIRETLRDICIPQKNGNFRARPDSFALFHNGVTLTAATHQHDTTSDILTLTEPSILNGCQTVKSAYLMLRAEGATSKLIDVERWRQVVVPVRVVITRDEELVRKITVGLNRQNTIRPAAFRANDPEQLRLAARFERIGVYYERQEKFFVNLKQSELAELTKRFPNSSRAPLTMEELAQSIAVVAEKPAVSSVSNVADLFEDALYGQIFAEDRVEDLKKLIFLRNVFVASLPVAKTLKGKSAALSKLQPGKFRYVIARALGRYAIKTQQPEYEQFNTAIESKLGPKHPLSLAMLKWCSHHHTELQQLIPVLWEIDGDAWRSPTDADAVATLLKKAKVVDFDVFG